MTPLLQTVRAAALVALALCLAVPKTFAQAAMCNGAHSPSIGTG